jgi:molybdopterin-guanine dinucleotide biosynthesis protein MobB
MTIPIITVIGKSGSGKTTLLEKLIPELKRRGYRVATIKHHSHSGFEIDYPGKDSWRHAQAGSEHVIIAAPGKIASYRLLERELKLDEIADGINNVDIILVEGYKRAGKPALEVIRAANNLELVGSAAQRFAVAADVALDVEVPQFSLNDVDGIANLIEALFLAHAENK